MQQHHEAGGPAPHYQEYAGPPQPYGGPPQAYGASPQQYGAAPQQYVGSPQQYGTPGQYGTPDHEGLQVDQLEHQRGLFPQVQHDGYPEVVTAAHKEDPRYAPALGIPPNAPPGTGTVTGKKSRRLLWIIVGVATVVILAVVIGCVVGLVVVPKSRGSDASTGAGPTPGLGPNASEPAAFQSACRGLVCPQIFAADTVGSNIYVFGRGIDNAIWYASTQAGSTSSWPSGSWRSLGGGPFLSQPSAVTWFRGERLSVFAVADPDRSVRSRTFSGSAWGASDRQWDNLLGQVVSPVSTCLVDGWRPDLWAAFPGTNTVAHNFIVNDSSAAPFFAPGQSSVWQASANFDEMIASPGIACRRSPFIHDLVVYGKDKPSVRHATWSPSTSWTLANDLGGRFVGSPVVVTTSDIRFDFFGIAEGGAMKHFSWSNLTGYSPIEDLGGSFLSVPAAIATDAGGGQQRIDVVALGNKDVLRHRVLVGSSWASEWEDLPVYGNSAPLLVDLKTQPARLGLFLLGRNGQLNQTSWAVSSDLSWRSLAWSGIGGNLTSAYFGV